MKYIHVYLYRLNQWIAIPVCYASALSYWFPYWSVCDYYFTENADEANFLCRLPGSFIVR